MSIIDATYFYAELNIANISQDYVTANVNAFIRKYESKYLASLLGTDFCADFLEGIAVTPTPEERFTELLDVIRNSTTKESPIANYVYYYYMSDLATQTTGTGTVKPCSENSSIASSFSKSVRAWNEMVLRTFEIKAYLYANAEAYPEYVIDLPNSDYNYYRKIYDGRIDDVPEIYAIKNTFDI